MQLCYFHRYEQVSGARVKINKHKLTSPHVDHVFISKDTHLHNLTSPLAFASVTVAMTMAVAVSVSVALESILDGLWHVHVIVDDA